MGSGFLEAVYQEALSIEFSLKKIPYQKEMELPVCYKDRTLSTSYRADFLGGLSISVLNYLKATRLETGLLLNFETENLEYKRFVFTSRKSEESVDI